MSRRYITAITIVMMSWACSAAACAQEKSATEDRTAARLARTKHFAFYSDFWMNLHDRLFELSRPEEGEDGQVEGETEVADPADGWQAALRFYREKLTSEHHLSDLSRRVRAQLIDPQRKADPEVEAILEHLRAAASFYRSHEWAEQDRLNRRWIAQVVPLIQEHEQEITERLAEVYQHEWPEKMLPIDLVGWGGRHGANTVVNPHHTMISSVDPGYRELAGLEMTFHETSHLLMGPRSGKVSEAIYGALGGRRIPRRDLWHTVLFFSTGQVVKEVLAEHERGDYVPYVYAQGLFERGWRYYREPLEKQWQPYLDGKVDLETAAKNLAAAIPSAEDVLDDDG